MTFDYVKFFTHKTYLFYGLLFTHMIVKAPAITAFYAFIEDIDKQKDVPTTGYSTSCVCVYVYVYVYVYVIYIVIFMFMYGTFKGIPNIIVVVGFASSWAEYA